MNWLGGARSRMNNQDPRSNYNANESNDTSNGQVRRRPSRLFDLAREIFPRKEAEAIVSQLKWGMEIERIRPRPSTTPAAATAMLRPNHVRSRTSSSAHLSASASSTSFGVRRTTLNNGNNGVNTTSGLNSRSSIISSVISQPIPRTFDIRKIKETILTQEKTICEDNNHGAGGDDGDGGGGTPDSMDEILSQMEIPTVTSGTSINKNMNTSISDIFAPTPPRRPKEREVINESNFDLGLTPPSPTISQMSTST